MLETVRHRGPDDDGIAVVGDVALGHVRLAIVDPTDAGRQPMTTPDERYCLVYNGELYNHRDFRAELEAAGIRFRGHSDTETLLWLLARCGTAILPRLNGIFAFALHDRLTDRVILGRDHLGVKPLYYAQSPRGRVLFASEIKALLASGEIERRANVGDLAELLMFHFIAGARTAFEDVTELLPGHFAIIDNGRIHVHRYWDPVTSARHQHESDGHLASYLSQAVTRQLMADVPIGVMSSGGLDSGVVMSMAARVHGPMQGFCFRAPALGYDELDDAREISGRYGVTVDEVTVESSEIPDLLQHLAWHHDEPLPRPHHIAAYAIARQARARGLKVLLSGEGGDELFGGYARYVDFATQLHTSGDVHTLAYGHNRAALPRIARFWKCPAFQSDFRFRVAEATNGFDVINRQLLSDQQTFLQHFLQRSDRMGMAAAVEVRVPLLDLALVEYTNRLPGHLKVSGTETKIGLKDALRGVLSGTTLLRRKQAFEMPMSPLLCEGPVAELVDDCLLDHPRTGQIFDPRGMAEVIADMRAGQHDLWKIVWLLLTTELWMRRFNVSV
jgi:asparagine synthase (glutamine-hydrolysing)